MTYRAELVLRQGVELVQSLFFASLLARTVEPLLRNNGPLTLKTSTGLEAKKVQLQEFRTTEKCTDDAKNAATSNSSVKLSPRLCITQERRLQKKFNK